MINSIIGERLCRELIILDAVPDDATRYMSIV
jgi:hypothetical protein